MSLLLPCCLLTSTSTQSCWISGDSESSVRCMTRLVWPVFPNSYGLSPLHFALALLPWCGDISIGFIAMGSLPFQLASMPRVHCHFHWLHCHRLSAISIVLIATGSLPFQLASLPRAHCHFNWLQCHEFIAIPLASLPFLGYIAFPIVIPPQIYCAHACLWPNVIGYLNPYLPLWCPICLLGAPSALWHFICLLAPPFHWQPKGTSAREVTLVLWRAYQQFVKWQHILFPRGRMWLDPCQYFVWPLKEDGSSSFFNCHVEESFGDSCQFSEFWSEKGQILTNMPSLESCLSFSDSQNSCLLCLLRLD